MKLTIENKIGGILLLMVLVAIANILIIYTYGSLEEVDSHIVKAAGRQGMLSQKIAKLAMSVAGGHRDSRLPLTEAVKLYHSSLRALENGGLVMGKTIPPAFSSMKELFVLNDRIWKSFRANAEIIINEERENPYFLEAVSYISETNEDLLGKNDLVVEAYTRLPDVSAYVNEMRVARRQVVLSQKMTRYALVLGIKGEGEVDHKWEEGYEETYRKLQKAMELYDKSFAVLQDGGVSFPWGQKIKEPPLPVYDTLYSLDEVWEYYRAEIENILKEPRDNPEFMKAVGYIRANSSHLLEISGRITERFAQTFSRKVSEMNLLLLFLFGADLIIFLAGYFMAHKLSRPIKELSQSAVLIGSGDFNHRIVIPKARDEIRDLALSFDIMVAKLKKNISRLKQEIHDREKAERELQRYAAELEQSNEEIKAFTYIVSHDLRSPLVNIKGFSGELGLAVKVIGSALKEALPSLGEERKKEVSLALHEDIPEALGFIDSSVTRMDNFIKAILKLSRLGHRQFYFEKIDMNHLVRESLKNFAHQVERDKVKITVESLPEVVSDRTTMEQIIGNLVDNAVKYLDRPGSGEIYIYGERRGREAFFHIKDNGRGIAGEDIRKIFQLFRRAGKQSVPGEGMGLSYVQTMVRSLGGRIWCESKPGEGTTFIFSVPERKPEGEGGEHAGV
ncbi:MAG: ATP-binding protein [bacterium]